MITGILLALGLLLSPATQLRPEGSSVGPGEIFLIAGIASAALQALFHSKFRSNHALLTILTFWGVFTIALSVGTFSAYINGIVNDIDLLTHDTKAYVLAGVFSLLCVVPVSAAARMRIMALIIVFVGSLLTLLQIAQGYGLFALADIDPWSWDRLRGWSENANQLAFVCMIQLLLSLHVAHSSPNGLLRLSSAVCALPPLIAGIMSKSDSFLVVLTVAVPLLTGLTLWRWLLDASPRSGARRSVALSIACLLPFLLFLAVPVFQVSTSKVAAIETFLYERNREAIDRDASQRFGLWREAFEIGVQSGMLGLGPGPHLLREPNVRVNNGGNIGSIRHFSRNPVADFEAHNTPIDLFTQGGLLAVAAFAWLIAITVLRAFKARHDLLVVLVTGVVIFTMFHFMIRHPLFWFVIAFCLVASTANHATGHRRRIGTA
jgi:hypothetical protein